jgi:hypothetical protein
VLNLDMTQGEWFAGLADQGRLTWYCGWQGRVTDFVEAENFEQGQ